MTDLVGARVRDVRSVWGGPLTLELGDAVTVLVGPNRAGTSNVAWALAAALDPQVRFRPERDVPRRPGHADDPPRPGVELRRHEQPPTWVTWDPATGARHVDGRPVTGHAVRAGIAETPRDVLRRLPTTPTDADRAAIAAQVLAVTRRALPEVTDVEVADDLAVHATDDLGSSLPVPELRVPTVLGAALHLAAQGTPPALVVVEAPEAFLHPSAQETVDGLLGEVAATTGAHLLVTTASPFVVPRVAAARVVALARDAAGATQVIGAAAGDETQARLLGGLLRDAGLAAVLDRVGQLPPPTRAVLIVEGGTDEAYLRTAARVLGREDVLADVVVRPAGGAMPAALAAVILRAESAVPLLVLLDHDDPGRRARDTLVSRFGFDRGEQVLTYAEAIDGSPPGVEAETLFDAELLRRFVRERGPSALHEERRLHTVDHVDLTSAGKAAFVPWVDRHVRVEHLAGWDRLLDLLAARLPPHEPNPTGR